MGKDTVFGAAGAAPKQVNAMKRTKAVRGKLNYREELPLLLLALPGLLGLLVFYVLPFLLSFSFALVDNNVTQNFVGLKNYRELFTSGAFLLGLKNTGIFMAVCVPLNMALPLILALLLQNTPRLSRILSLLFLLPLVIPSGSVVHFWKSIWGLNGLVNKLFFPDSPTNWLTHEACRTIVTIVFLWKNAGYNMVLFLAGLRAIPQEYYECAAVEGAGPWAMFRRITLPCIVPTTFLVFIMSIINSFKSFKEIYLLCGAYPHQSIYMLQHFMNNQFSSLNYQKLTAGAYVLSVFIIGLVLALYGSQNKRGRDL